MISTNVYDALLRNFIGLDHMSRLAQLQNQTVNYPPFNIEQVGDDNYVLTLAVAGFSEDDLSISQLNGVLTIQGEKGQAEKLQNNNQSKVNKPSPTYLHRGLSFRDFTRTFTLAEHVQVVSAEMHNGMLTINLERQVPETAKPKRIPINTLSDAIGEATVTQLPTKQKAIA